MEATQERMACMEVWGGNSATWSTFVVPGLDLWVHNQPYQDNTAGGDVYYLSSCASGRITRLLLGDVSGHGAEAAPIADRLRTIMRKHVNFVNQDRVVKLVNDEFESDSSMGRFATALIGTWFSSRRRLTLCLAGHPPPLIFRKATGKWSVLDSDNGNSSRPNMPIGVVEGQDFASTQLTLQSGDMMLAYTDALFESRTADNEMLLAEGLAEVANSLGDPEAPGQLIPRLLEHLRHLHEGNLAEDDVTVLLARANSAGVPLSNSLLAPFRLIGRLFRSQT